MRFFIHHDRTTRRRDWLSWRSMVAAAVLVASGLAVRAAAEDWPTFRHDARRSSATAESLSIENLELAWTHRPQQAPCPAWPGPARWDAYVKRPVLSSMRDYDESFHVTVVGDSIYFGSSADDSVHCLDAATGKEHWAFTVDGPVRFPPTFDQGKLYFGSDDGAAYCIAADSAGDSARLVWKNRPSPDRHVLNDGRLISQWPCRTGVMVLDGIAYFGGSLLPWEKSYLCAVRADTGLAEGPGTFVQEMEGATLEGATLAADDHLIATQGRAGPLLFSRATGKNRRPLEGMQGGSFALIAADGNRYFGPGPKEGFISEANAAHSTAIARRVGAMALVAKDNHLYALERKILGCLRQKPEEWIWRRPCDSHEAVILAGETLFVGGDGTVTAVSTADGEPLWQRQVEGRAQGLVAANGSLYVSTDRGVIYAFRPGPLRPSGDKRPPASLVASSMRESVTHDLPPTPDTRVPSEIRRGPILRFVDAAAAMVSWETTSPVPTTLIYGPDGDNFRYHEAVPRTKHEATLKGLLASEVYRYSLLLEKSGETLTIGPFECDTHLNFAPPSIGEHRDPFELERKAAGAGANDEILRSQHLPRQGLALVFGADNGPLAYDLARHSELNVVILERAHAKIDRLRRRLRGTGMYGTRLTVLPAEAYDHLPLPNNFVNLIVMPTIDASADSKVLLPTGEELYRLLRPLGGQLWIGPFHQRDAAEQQRAFFGKIGNSDARRKLVAGQWFVVEKPASPGSGTWTHQYGLGNNSTYAGETLDDAFRTSDFEVQWIGRPGPRFQSDRENRKPAPLCAGGRLFVQGLDRILAMDAYNGVILWSREIPDSRRFNMRNDSANWCADDERLYLAVRDACWVFDAASGDLVDEHVLPPVADIRGDYQWGYIGTQNRMVIGSAVKAGATYRDFWGGQFWYTDSEGPLAAKVCSHALFAVDPAKGHRTWVYRGGAVVNTSITLMSGTAVFAEGRHPKVVSADGGRIGLSELWEDLHLVALDLASGAKRWERRLQLGPATTMFSIAEGEGALVVVASARGNYRVAVFSAADGEPLWETGMPWEANGKGGDSARPAIVDGVLYVSPRAFDLKSGRPSSDKLVRGACGSYAAARRVFVARLGNLGLWAPRQGQASTWDRMRPDCWLSAIPAAGMVLAPEGGGGCSCGGWLETSIAFAPKSNRPPFDPATKTMQPPSPDALSPTGTNK